MNFRPFFRFAALAALLVIGSASRSAAQGFGIKVGPTFDEFSDEALDFDTRTGIHAGIFVGGSRDKVSASRPS